jgi:hypothetical protein
MFRDIKRKYSGMSVATIEDLAFPEKMGPVPILYERGHSQPEGITAENGACPHFFDKINLVEIDITRTSGSK